MQNLGTPMRGGTIRVVGQAPDVDYMDPQRAYFTFSWQLMRCICRTLMTYPGKPAPEGCVPVPDIAEAEPTVSSDGLTYTFRLRRGVMFGAPLNREVQAGDFKLAFERALDPELHSAPGQYFLDIVGAEAIRDGATTSLSGVEVPDPQRLVVHLRRPINDFVNIMALTATVPAPPEIVRSHNKFDYGKHLVPTGPYLIAEHIPGQLVRLARNPAWDRPTDPVRGAYIDGLEIQMGCRREDVVQRVESNESDMSCFLHPDHDDFNRYRERPEIGDRFFSDPTGCMRYIALDCFAGPTSDIRVRQAINYAVDKQAFARVRGGAVGGNIAGNILPPTINGHRPFDLYPSPDHRGDPERARQLLADAGYPNGFRTWGLVADASFHPKLGELLTVALAKAGIELDLKTVTVDSYYKDYMNKVDVHVPIGVSNGWCKDWPGNGARSCLATLFHSSSLDGPETTNFCRLRDPELDQMIDKAITSSQEEADEIWAQADRHIMEQAACVPWLHDNHLAMTSERVRNYFSHAFLVGPDWTNVWLIDGSSESQS
jgi:peptide/nickel transport system substrate-binding protein